MNDEFYLLDARAGWIAIHNNGILDTEDNEKFVLLVGTAKECCEAANDGTYGDHNVVSDLDYDIQWEWFQTGQWISNQKQ